MILYRPVGHHSSTQIEKSAHVRLFEFFYRGREWGREHGSTPWTSPSEAPRSRHPLLLQNLNTVDVLTSFPVLSLKRSVISSHVYSPSSSSDNSASTVSSASVNRCAGPVLRSAAALPVSTLPVDDLVNSLWTYFPSSRELFYARRASVPRATSCGCELCPLFVRQLTCSALDRGERRPTRTRPRVVTHHTGCFQRRHQACARRSRPDGAVDLLLRPPSRAIRNRWRRHILDTWSPGASV